MDTGSAYLGPRFSVHREETPDDGETIARIVKRAQYELLRSMINEAREENDLFAVAYLKEYAQSKGIKLMEQRGE